MLSRGLSLVLLTVSLSSGQVGVLTYHDDNARTGQNLKETKLTLSNVNPASFGLKASWPVDGQIYAQPLYLSNITIPGVGVRNVVFVATENDSVYAFDAEGGSGASPLWQVAFANPANGVTPVPSSDLSCPTAAPQVGITGTPVIDPVGQTLYVVAKTKESVSGGAAYYQRLHALDVATGAEKFGGPFSIQASLPGTCNPNLNGRVIFSPLFQNQRAGLVLSKGILYVTWASHCDANAYTGWVMAFNSLTGKLLHVFNTDPDTGTTASECRGGIWQSGAAPAVDSAGNLFFATGNGYFDADTAGNDYGDSQVKLSLTKSGFKVADYFTPYDQAGLDSVDGDLGSGGVLLLPDQPGAFPHLSVQAGKEGSIYLLNRDSMGGYNPAGDSQIVQELPSAIGGVWGMPAYFNGTVYFGGQYDSLKAFALANGLLSSNPATQSVDTFGFPGPGVSISANGQDNGIVWALDGSPSSYGGGAVLHAYDAANLAHELYNSNQNPERDGLGPAVRFAVPTVANGRVYVVTGNALAAFALLPNSPRFALSSPFATMAVTPGGSGSDPIQVQALPGFGFKGAVTLTACRLT